MSHISFPKEMRERAIADGKGLFAIGVVGDEGRVTTKAPLDVTTAAKLFEFCTYVVVSKLPPSEAYRKAYGRKGAPK